MSQYLSYNQVSPRCIPWKQIFIDLSEAGITPSNISGMLGIGWSSVQRWREGTEPKHSVGVAILTLHSRHCGEDMTNQRITEAE